MAPRDDPHRRKDPFEMLEQSHRRLQEHLELLRAAVAGLGGDGNTAAVERVREVSEFIDRSVKRHERDEEESLFPRLTSDGDLAPILAELEGEHRHHEQLHAELRSLAEAPDAAKLQDLSRRLDDAYERHVDIEEARVFPAARAVLDDATLATMAQEMHARRGRGGPGGRTGGGGGGGGGGRRRGGGGGGRGRR
ncbi:MAG: hemerythrin domain-containing protein [Planctomycetota bacterium]